MGILQVLILEFQKFSFFGSFELSPMYGPIHEIFILHMSLVAKNPVFGVDNVIFKPICSASETSLTIEFSPEASLDMLLSNKCITKALIRLHVCAGWSAPLLFSNP